MSSPCAAAGNTAHLGSWYIVSTHLSDAKHQNLARRCLHEIFTELASIHSESFLLRCSCPFDLGQKSAVSTIPPRPHRGTRQSKSWRIWTFSKNYSKNFYLSNIWLLYLSYISKRKKVKRTTMVLAGVLRIELRHYDLESHALTVTLHPNMHKTL